MTNDFSRVDEVIGAWRAASKIAPAEILSQGTENWEGVDASNVRGTLHRLWFDLKLAPMTGQMDYRLRYETPATNSGKVASQSSEIRWQINDSEITRFSRTEQGQLVVSYFEVALGQGQMPGSPGSSLVLAALGKSVAKSFRLSDSGPQFVMMDVPEFLEEAKRTSTKIEVKERGAGVVEVLIHDFGRSPGQTDRLVLDLSGVPLLLSNESRFEIPQPKPFWASTSIQITATTEVNGLRLPSQVEYHFENSRGGRNWASCSIAHGVPTVNPFPRERLLEDVKSMTVLDSIRQVAYEVHEPFSASPIVRSVEAKFDSSPVTTTATPEQIAESIAARPPLPGFKVTGPIQPYVETAASAPPPAAAASPAGSASSPAPVPYLWLALAVVALALLVYFTRKPKARPS